MHRAHFDTTSLHLFISESFYGSPPPNSSLTKWPVSKPAPGCTSCNTVSLDTPTSSIDRPFFAQRKYVDTFLSIASFLVSSSHETFVEEKKKKKTRVLRGTTVEPVFFVSYLFGWVCPALNVFTAGRVRSNRDHEES